MQRRYLILLAIAATLVWPAIYSLTRPTSTPTKKLTLVSDAYLLDKIYRSMEGPMSVASGIHLNASDKAQVQWITGLDAQVVDATKETPVSQEFFCHANLTFGEHSGTPAQFNHELGDKTHLDWRLFTLAPGRLSIELPPGFGVPVPADAPLDYVTMSLNLNQRNQVMNVRMRTNLHTVAADQPGAPTKALFRRALYVLQPHDKSGKMECVAHMGQQIGAGCGGVV